MTLTIKSIAAALAVTLLSAGAAAAAGDCCCKDKDGKMACCEKMKQDGAAPASEAPKAPEPKHEHQH